MFTGIIQEIATVVEIKKNKNIRTHYVTFSDSLINNLSVGSSVSHNGCCLTVTNIYKNIVSFDLIEETLKITNLNEIQVGDKINLERSINLLKGEIGGHLMSGHIFCTAKINKIIEHNNTRKMWFIVSNDVVMKYIFFKGFVGIDGISLTVGEIKDNYFCVYLIPETLLRTTIGSKKIGDYVNIEIDYKTQSIVNTVESILERDINKIKKI